MKVYFDNAATTAVDEQVVDTMQRVLRDDFGNPSSIHAFGRRSKSLIEAARKSIAHLINAQPSEVVFTAGGTEADNHGLTIAVRDLGVKTIITSPIEHHAVLHTVESLNKHFGTKVLFVNHLPNGHVDLDHLDSLLIANAGAQTLVALMHGNNEIGNVLPLLQVSERCKENGVLLQSDMVQTFGHYKVDFEKYLVHFSACSAHKFHGPKGVGFFYCNRAFLPQPLIYGGSQERNIRGGTENLIGIVGMAKAFELAHESFNIHEAHILKIKQYMMQQLLQHFEGVTFNGDANGNSLYTVLNVTFPPFDGAEMLLFNLDIRGIAASGGSACTSGSDQGSHVLRHLGVTKSDAASVRFSFSKYNTEAEVDYCINALQEIVKKR